MERAIEVLRFARILAAERCEEEVENPTVVTEVLEHVAEEEFDDVVEPSLVGCFEGSVISGRDGPEPKFVGNIGGAVSDGDFLDEPLAGKQLFVNCMNNWEKQELELFGGSLNGAGVFGLETSW